MKLESAFFVFTTAYLAAAAPSSSSAQASAIASAAVPSATSGASNSSNGPLSGSHEPGAAAIGTLYFTTNSPNGNSIVMANIGTSGNLTYAGTVSTAGNGVHGNDGGAFGPDATFANTLLVVHPERQLLATANLQSSTVVLFSINPNDPTKLKMIGRPVPSQGDYPSTLTFNKAGNTLCVANGGTVANIACFDVTSSGLRPQKASIRPLPNYNQTNPPTGPDFTSGAIAFTPDEKNLVVAIKGHRTPPFGGFIVVWPLQNGVPAQSPIIVDNPGPGSLSFSLTPIPGRNAFISADLSSTIEVYDLEGDIRQANKSTGTNAITVAGPLGLCWSTYSPTLNRFYFSAPGLSGIVEATVDHNLKPSVVTNYTIPGALVTDVSVATINHQDYLYVLATNEPGVSILRLDGPGKTTLLANTNFGSSLSRDSVSFQSNYAQGLGVFLKN